MCGILWLSHAGDRIYTACGNTYRTSEIREQNMTYIGSIDTYTTEDSFWGNFISSLDESSGANEITAVTHLQDYDCGITESGEFCEFIEVFSHGYFNKLSTVFFS